jgi:hypothetical protein
MRRGWKIKDGHIRDKMRILDQNEKGVENKGGLGLLAVKKERRDRADRMGNDAGVPVASLTRYS